MPNWVSTQLEVMGNHDTIMRFRNGIDLNKGILDSYIPCPQELKDTVSGFYSDEEKQRELDSQYEKNLAKYGYRNWYDWQYDIWGVKWGDEDTYIDEDITIVTQGESSYSILKVSFQTPWGFADKGFLALSLMFPELVFEFRVEEEAGFFAGYIVIREGQFIFDETFAPCEYEETMPFDEESHDRFIEWMDDRFDDIESRLPAYHELVMN